MISGFKNVDDHWASDKTTCTIAPRQSSVDHRLPTAVRVQIALFLSVGPGEYNTDDIHYSAEITMAVRLFSGMLVCFTTMCCFRGLCDARKFSFIIYVYFFIFFFLR